MNAVFISYRRDDSEGQARALASTLVKYVGKNAAFMDVDGIDPGRDFREVLNERLASCNVLLALIGPKWLDARDSSGRRRLDDPDDYVRQEIAAALRRRIPVIPVLLQGAPVPAKDLLPDDIQDLVYRNSFEIGHRSWDSDVNEMIRRLHLTRPYAAYRGWVAAAVVVVVGALGVGAWRVATNAGRTSSPSTVLPKANEPDQTLASKQGDETAVGSVSKSDTGIKESVPRNSRPKPQPDDGARSNRDAGTKAPAPLVEAKPQAESPSTESRFVNAGVAALNGRDVLIVDQRLGPDFPVTARVAKGVGAVDSLFKPSFVTEGLFSRVHGGDVEVLRSMHIDGIQLIALGVKSVRTVVEHIAGSSVSKSTVTFDVRVIYPSRGFSSETFTVAEADSDFDGDRATAKATDKATDGLTRKLAGM